MTWCAVEQRDLRLSFFFSGFQFCQCVNSIDARGTANYQKMKFEFAIMICIVVAKEDIKMSK